MRDVSKLSRVELRRVWRIETDLTKWLEDNIEVLGEALDVSLSGAERERTAGDFSVDLVAEDAQGNAVIIENQLGRSDHDHLGKLIAYTSLIGAKTAIWIVGNPRPEHIASVNWLNESSSIAFYLVKVEAVQIGDSPPAPLLTQIVGPSEESRKAGEIKEGMAERYLQRERFWKELLERAKGRTKLHAAISPSRNSWVSTGAGRSGLSYNYAIRQHEGQVELYIDRGKNSDEENKAIFDELFASRASIEETFGDKLEWQRLDSRRACRIRKMVAIAGYRDEAKWTAQQDAMVDVMVRFEKALRPHIGRLRK